METKIIKLRNGEELVGNVHAINDDFVKVQNPLKVNLYPRMKGGKIEERNEHFLVGLVIVITNHMISLKTM